MSRCVCKVANISDYGKHLIIGIFTSNLYNVVCAQDYTILNGAFFNLF